MKLLGCKHFQRPPEKTYFCTVFIENCVKLYNNQSQLSNYNQGNEKQNNKVHK